LEIAFTLLTPIEFFLSNFNMVKYFSIDLGFVSNLSCSLNLQSCVHFLVEVITILNDARLSLNDVSVGEVSRGAILSYGIIFKDNF
jgi:hypothetical protein